MQLNTATPCNWILNAPEGQHLIAQGSTYELYRAFLLELRDARQNVLSN